MLVGALLMSVGFNVLQLNRIKYLEKHRTHGWVTDIEYEKIKQEIERLDQNKGE
jgi:hypothetical protein